MFPLEKNSVIVYHPSEEYFETPVSASAPEENSYYSKTFGMIFYSYILELNFSDCEIHYKIRKKLYNMNGFWIFMTLFGVIMFTEIFKGFTAIDNLIEGVLCHHERFDGTGYPLGLRGEQIPFVSRIIAVADSFDAMSSNRCYRRHLTDEEIIDELNRKKGTQFDAKVVDAFIKAFNSLEFEKTNQNIIREIRLLS